jgi:shikimate kinase
MELPPRPLWLVGMMGSGKTTVARALAARAGVAAVDLDERVERVFGQTVAELFARGEPHFRGCERAALLSLLAEPGFATRASVIATGGGVVLDPRNTAAMTAVGNVVWLDVPCAQLEVRLGLADGPPPASATPGVPRPLLALPRREALARLRELDAARAPLYAAAGARVGAEGPVDAVVERVAAVASIMRIG